jgi:hypothetical protein
MIKSFLVNDEKLYQVLKITETYSDEFGLFIFDLVCHEFFNYNKVQGSEFFTRMARHRNKFLMTEEQAKENYPEYFI